uniref:Secreted protein n=1 Tax=Anolis carolinensis TaxID=28377 RepID=A0A803T145_ANOCA
MTCLQVYTAVLLACAHNGVSARCVSAGTSFSWKPQMSAIAKGASNSAQALCVPVGLAMQAGMGASSVCPGGAKGLLLTKLPLFFCRRPQKQQWQQTKMARRRTRAGRPRSTPRQIVMKQGFLNLFTLVIPFYLRNLFVTPFLLRKGMLVGI